MTDTNRKPNTTVYKQVDGVDELSKERGSCAHCGIWGWVGHFQGQGGLVASEDGRALLCDQCGSVPMQEEFTEQRVVGTVQHDTNVTVIRSHANVATCDADIEADWFRACASIIQSVFNTEISRRPVCDQCSHHLPGETTHGIEVFFDSGAVGFVANVNGQQELVALADKQQRAFVDHESVMALDFLPRRGPGITWMTAVGPSILGMAKYGKVASLNMRMVSKTEIYLRAHGLPWGTK